MNISSGSNTERPGFLELNELASNVNGGTILFATDDWFAQAENLLSHEEAIFKADLYTDCGKWMDGWETRRRRSPGHDWCIIKLGISGKIYGIELDTAFFTGNFAPKFSLQGGKLSAKDEASIPGRGQQMLGKAADKEMLATVNNLKTDAWDVLIPMTNLQAGYSETRHNYFAIKSDEVYTHLRLNIYPDGGIARVRVFGVAHCEELIDENKEIDLLSMKNGGICIDYSNAHYGHPRNLIRPGRGINMGDGWETARRLDRPPVIRTDSSGILQVPGNEWAVFKMAHLGTISHIDVDTFHFKGNFPDSVNIQGVLKESSDEWNIKEWEWQTILPTVKLSAHCVHSFDDHYITNIGPFSHIKVTIAPDGGLSRLRIVGHPVLSHQ